MGKIEVDLARATSYPYRIPDHSYVYQDGGIEPLTTEVERLDFEDRTPVLAVGSNQSPEQLSRKFVGTDWGMIPVVRTDLKDFDVVYSAHITAYGSVAATLHQAPGVTVSLFVNWLDDRQLERMHETELPNENYEYGRLTGIEPLPETGPAVDDLYVYNSQRGVFAPEGEPITLDEVPACNRYWPSRTQPEIQTLVRDHIAPGKPIEEFIGESVTDGKMRQQRSKKLAGGALRFSYSGYVPSGF